MILVPYLNDVRIFGHENLRIIVEAVVNVGDIYFSANIMLTGRSKGKVVRQSIINPNWDFSQMGVGGLDTQFQAIFRRAFASRVYPPELIEQLNMKHVRGILLYGPPGTGKTLMARQIGQMLNGREPKIVNGPQILNKYVGESEANIRKLFEDAEEVRDLQIHCLYPMNGIEGRFSQILILFTNRSKKGWGPTLDFTS